MISVPDLPKIAKKIAIIGTGPTGLYSFAALLRSETPFAITLFEQADEAGVGMPYNDHENMHLMLANIASIEIPPLTETYLEWLMAQDEGRLIRYGVKKGGLHDRQFLPRILLGEYFRDQFLAMLAMGRQNGFEIQVRETCCVVDLEARQDAVRLWTQRCDTPEDFDLVIIATGHIWPEENRSEPHYFPSPWSGLLDADIPAAKIGIMGTSLSAIDAAMAVAAQHGAFMDRDAGGPANLDSSALCFRRADGSEGLQITLMSRSGILPEADFYCPIPYEPLSIATKEAVAAETEMGGEGLLDRLFTLFAQEIAFADPHWGLSVRLDELDADSFADAYFADRLAHDAFRWAAYNLAEVERHKREQHVVAWRYAILRMHEVFQDIVPILSDDDRQRFDCGLARVFTDNYAAIPSESIRRLLALRQAQLIDTLGLGPDYKLEQHPDGWRISADGIVHEFDIFIDARGQKPLMSKDLPFPSLRAQLLAEGDDIPDIGDDYSLLNPPLARGRIAFGAIPYLMHDHPFVQGITASAEIGQKIAAAVRRAPTRARRKLGYMAE